MTYNVFGGMPSLNQPTCCTIKLHTTTTTTAVIIIITEMHYLLLVLSVVYVRHKTAYSSCTALLYYVSIYGHLIGEYSFYITGRKLPHVPCEAKKTAPFYFCNSLVRTSPITIIFGRHIFQ